MFSIPRKKKTGTAAMLVRSADGDLIPDECLQDDHPDDHCENEIAHKVEKRMDRHMNEVKTTKDDDAAGNPEQQVLEQAQIEHRTENPEQCQHAEPADPILKYDHPPILVAEWLAVKPLGSAIIM